MIIAPKHSGDIHPPPVEHFDPGKYMIVALRRAVVNKQDIHVEVKGQGNLHLLGSRSQYSMKIADDSVFFSAPLAKAKVTLLKADDPRIPGKSVIGRGVDELLWRAAYHASAGRLMKGCCRDDVVKLEFWPNFTRLPHGPNAMRIAALLCRYPTSISPASRLLKINLGEVSQFYSAVRAAGLARAVNRTHQELDLEPYRSPYRFTALLKKVARL